MSFRNNTRGQARSVTTGAEMTPAPHRGSSGDKNKPRGGSSGGYSRPSGSRAGGPSRSQGGRPSGGAPRSFDDRAPRSNDDRGERAPRRSFDDRPARSYGDRPQGGQARPGDRGPRSYDDRPQRSNGDRPQGDRPQPSYRDRPQGERPQRSYGDRPQGGQGRPSGDRPQRSFSDRPDRSGRGRYDNQGATSRSDRDSRPPRPVGPSIPADVTGQELDKAIRGDLRTLSLEAAEIVSRHLVMTARLLDDRPDLAWEHAKAAVARGGRLAVVREAAGVAAYTAGEYADALAQFRAARRISGSDSYWPLMADCERGLGRPERAISMAGADEVDRLDRAGRVEMRIVASGARRDLGQLEAAVVTLQCPELSSSSTESWSARLKFAYADALLAAGREDEAREWFAKTVDVDASDETDAAERLADLDGIVWVDTLEGEDDEEGDEDRTDVDDDDLADFEAFADDDNLGEFAPPALEPADASPVKSTATAEDLEDDEAVAVAERADLDIDDLALAGDDPADYRAVARDQDVPDSSSD
jgi:tetratricopeptide (TPR) repeat protein